MDTECKKVAVNISYISDLSNRPIMKELTPRKIMGVSSFIHSAIKGYSSLIKKFIAMRYSSATYRVRRDFSRDIRLYREKMLIILLTCMAFSEILPNATRQKPVP